MKNKQKRELTWNETKIILKQKLVRLLENDPELLKVRLKKILAKIEKQSDKEGSGSHEDTPA